MTKREKGKAMGEEWLATFNWTIIQSIHTVSLILIQGRYNTNKMRKLFRNSKAIAGEKNKQQTTQHKQNNRRVGCHDWDFMKMCSFLCFFNLDLYVWLRSLTTSSCIISDTVENSTHIRNYKPPGCFGNSDRNFTGVNCASWLTDGPPSSVDRSVNVPPASTP